MTTATVEIHGRGDQVPAELISSQGGVAIRSLPPMELVRGPEESQGRPTQVLLGTLATFGYRLAKPIPITLNSENDSTIASWQDVDEFGIGSSMSSACEDLGRTVVELYESLKMDHERLGPDLAGVWQLLQQYVIKST